MGGFFITGTDTGVGKTAVAAALAYCLKAQGIDTGVMKPVASGGIKEDQHLVCEDALFLAGAAGVEDEHGLICPCCLELPLAPAVAADLAAMEVDFQVIMQAYQVLSARHRLLLVEGVGGIMVPLSGEFLVADLILQFGLPAIVVARNSLGTINHTLLTLAYARQRGITVAGVIINGTQSDADDLSAQTNPKVLEKLSGVPVLGVIPHDRLFGERQEKESFFKLVEENINWPVLLG